MRTRGGLGLVAVVAVGGCTFTSVSSVWFDGSDHVVAAVDNNLIERVLRDQAARDLECPAAQLRMADLHGRATEMVGCGRRGVFITVDLIATDEHGSRYWLRAVDVSDPRPPPPTPIGNVSAVAAAEGRLSSGWTAALRWIHLVELGAKDLACERTALTPDFVPQGPRKPPVPIVEGCGKRATYLAERFSDVLRLSSIVEIGSDPPAP